MEDLTGPNAQQATADAFAAAASQPAKDAREILTARRLAIVANKIVSVGDWNYMPKGDE